MARHNLLQRYDELRSCAQVKAYCPEATDLLAEIYSISLDLLNSASRQELASRVENKDYFAFADGQRFSRAINLELWEPSADNWTGFTNAMKNNDLTGYDAVKLEKILYTVAISFCASVDLIKQGDQKTPGTFFEYFIAYLYSWRVGVQPQNSIQILNLDDERTKLPTDFIFDLGVKRPKFHVPVKTSTRERSIMLWAHQKLLDGVYGVGRFMGTPVLLAETKTDKAKKEVVEICVPEQWRLYQLYIARLTRIYYFDLPSTYKKLNWEFPPVAVKPFSEFFLEWANLSPF